MTLLAIVQGAALRCNVPVPAAAIGIADPNVQKLIAYAQDAGDDFAERWPWLPMQAQTTFTGDGVTTLFTPPTGFTSLQPSDTFVSSVYPTVPLVGPINNDDLLRLKALPYTTTPAVWRRIGTQIEFYPAPASGEIITFNYVTRSWITNSSGTPYFPSVWTADTDISRINERCIRLGTVWRWKRGQGLDYAEEMASSERSFDLNAGQENQERIVAMSFGSIQGDTWFPGTITDLTTPLS
jgi:hypothetical protein